MVDSGSIEVRPTNTKAFNVTWTPPPFPGEDLEYFVVLRDALKKEEILSQDVGGKGLT
jgi:hypothetical protein